MLPEYHSLFVPPPSVCSLELVLCTVLFAAVFGFGRSPGGLAWALSKAQAQPKSSIPGPSGLPLLGLAFAFTGSLTHRVLGKLAESFKAVRLMAFSVGLTRFVISTHPDSAKEILSSSAFADRPVKESAYELLFGRAMGFAPYGEYWRNLRRISATHFFSPKRIACFGGLRQKIGSEMVTQIEDLMEKNGVVEIKRVLHLGSLNNVMMSAFGRSYDFKSLDGCELEHLVSEGYELLGIFNWVDHFPLLVHRVTRAESGGVEGDDGDFVDVLLDLENENKLSDSDMIAVLWEMIFRGTDTVAILLEWIIARMVLHPDIQAKAQSEIDSVVGKTRTVLDSDLPNLPYLLAIVKETLRMHPPGPLLSWARLAIHDTHVGDHFIPAGTTAMVNMWAITHDERIWSEPNEYMPERFMEEDVTIMGSDLRLAPFGSGRRVCPGKAMGLATVQLWLAHLLQSFKWVASDNGVDLSEVLKLSMEMKHPLVCKAVARVS
ncbi:cytochrome P450, family 78, subfamily A, polypeptide 5 [Actinidia rufa]|uniref:Cytochrome P450, family 78, subfamily A, polypeptide 5 n=1 Tax=Actinidia rufa TaxID=165716 RepID=A0A7J0GN56_9ERIC|nr:cytochrome P450, family 78, subfamily A, polypeptide 5 [Actinidia rufa]